MKIPEDQIARWIKRLQQYDFKVEHQRGKIHNNADALSRPPCKEACGHCREVEKKEGIVNLRRTTTELRQGWSTEELIEAQEADPDIKLLGEWKRDNRRPTWKDISTMGSITKGTMGTIGLVSYRKWAAQAEMGKYRWERSQNSLSCTQEQDRRTSQGNAWWNIRCTFWCQ
ncbi:hypothetical protein WA026_014274 [Henosepilachna vigintioctopunctata]|uniref:Reverse transcriptase RNase H-like domain-containing protein n=1 Tax=Henosepilachna vigintioctopunctata TaxID=420089 RepID=A0AAW1TTS6_9CUCU